MTLHDNPTPSILALVRAFLDATVAAPAEAMVDTHFADPAFVGDLSGVRSVPAAALSAGIAARARLAAAAGPRVTTLEEWEAIALGPVMVLASARWRVTAGDKAVDLVSDYLIDVSSGTARCLSYSTRQNVMDVLAASGMLPEPPSPDVPAAPA
jgi:hypothetical protein